MADTQPISADRPLGRVTRDGATFDRVRIDGNGEGWSTTFEADGQPALPSLVNLRLDAVRLAQTPRGEATLELDCMVYGPDERVEYAVLRHEPLKPPEFAYEQAVCRTIRVRPTRIVIEGEVLRDAPE
jgi:hypothetical protein